MSCLFALWLLVAHDPGASVPTDVCLCKQARATDGRCGKCRVGYFATVRIESQALYEVLDSHGHEVVEKLTRCPNCRQLISTGGYCEPCHMGYVNGRGYFGKIGFFMARGHVVDPATARHPCCPKNGGWCPTCKRGIVGNRLFDNKADCAAACKYFAILLDAVAKSRECEFCAMAMIADSRCPKCKIEYRDGKPVQDSAALLTQRN